MQAKRHLKENWDIQCCDMTSFMTVGVICYKTSKSHAITAMLAFLGIMPFSTIWALEEF